MSGKTYSKTIGASDPLIVGGGNSIALHSVGSTVTVKLFYKGNKVHEAEDVAAGWHFFDNDTLNQDKFFFDKAEISGAAQTVKVEVSTRRSGINILSGAVAVTGDVQGITNPLTPETLVTQYGGAITNSSTTIVTPAANTAGIRIDNINHADGIGGKANVLTKSSAPGTFDDSGSRCIWSMHIDAGNGFAFVDKVNFPIIIPAGEGLYTFGSAANVADVSIDYEVL